MKKARASVAGFAFVLLAGSANAQTPALETGSILIGGTAHFTMEDQENAADITSVSVVPRLEFFVSDGVSVGGQAGLNYAAQGDASSTGFVVGPAVTWYLVRDGRLHPFVRGTVDYVRNTISANGDDVTVSGLGLTGAAGVLYLLTDGVGVNAQLFISRLTTESGDVERDTTSGGLRVGVSAFVF